MPRTIFVSCGQRTEDEIRLGRGVADVIEHHGMHSFFAQDVHSASDLNSEVFRAIQSCDAFIGVLQRRGVVRYADFPPVERSSVWIQQEIAIFCYRGSLEQKPLPIRVYTERGIRREGVMEIALVNPIEFDHPEEVLTDVNKWLTSREFEEHPVLARREELFQRRIAQMNEDQWLLLELIAANCTGPDDYALGASVSGDFFLILRHSGASDDDIRGRYNRAYGTLASLTLIREVDDRTSGHKHIWIVKQWFLLVLDELRRRGRRV